MHLKFAATEGIPKDVHFVLIESVAEHIIDTLYVQDDRIEAVEVKIVKLAIAEERSEEHTSELQSLMRISYAVFCLKKKKTKITHTSSRKSICTSILKHTTYKTMNT